MDWNLWSFISKSDTEFIVNLKDTVTLKHFGINDFFELIFDKWSMLKEGSNNRSIKFLKKRYTNELKPNQWLVFKNCTHPKNSLSVYKNFHPVFNHAVLFEILISLFTLMLPNNFSSMVADIVLNYPLYCS